MPIHRRRDSGGARGDQTRRQQLRRPLPSQRAPQRMDLPGGFEPTNKSVRSAFSAPSAAGNGIAYGDRTRLSGVKTLAPHQKCNATQNWRGGRPDIRCQRRPPLGSQSAAGTPSTHSLMVCSTSFLSTP